MNLWVSGTIKSGEKEGQIAIPVTILRDRTLAPLEAVSEYLKDQKGMSYHEIAVLLNRNDRTIWTCYSRAKKKHQAKISSEHEHQQNSGQTPEQAPKQFHKLSSKQSIKESSKEDPKEKNKEKTKEGKSWK